MPSQMVIQSMVLMVNLVDSVKSRPLRSARHTVLQFFVPEPADNAEPVTQIAHPREPSARAVVIRPKPINQEI